MFTDMKDRIIQFLNANNLNSTKFADQIGVQRSSISHILSGRNKPSYDFIEKMLLTYPKLNAQWLITGKGNMFIDQPYLFNEQKVEKNLTQRELFIQNQNEDIPVITKPEKEKENNESKPDYTSKQIEKVMIFYNDGTFKQYKPE